MQNKNPTPLFSLLIGLMALGAFLYLGIMSLERTLATGMENSNLANPFENARPATYETKREAVAAYETNPDAPVALFFYPERPIFHAKETVNVNGTNVYGYSKFSVYMKNQSEYPVQILSVKLTSVGTGATSGLGDIKDYWKYPAAGRILEAGQGTSFDKEWGFTTPPGHEKLSYVFDICWNSPVSEKGCASQRVDLQTAE